MKFRYPLLVSAIILVVQVALIASGLYDIVPSLDIPMHFAGGLAMGMLAIALHYDMTDKHDLKRHPDWYRLLFVLGFVMLIGVAWEFHEYVLDNTVVIWYGWAKSQLNIADTMLDLVLDAAGGLVAFIGFRKWL